MAAINQEIIDQFKEFTGVSDYATARQMLEVCNGNLQAAIQLFLADGPLNSTAEIGRDEDEAQILHETARHREAEDPIVLGESSRDEEVRGPIAPVTGSIVEQSYRQYYNAGSRREPANPIFEQYRDHTIPTRRAREVKAEAEDSLVSLFRPPIDLIAPHDWDNLRKVATKNSNWLLVNIQDPSEFACQILNRDCWSNDIVKGVVKENFLFWQVYAKSSDGRRIVGYYVLKEFPAVFIVDPRTGECVYTVKSCKEPDELAIQCKLYFNSLNAFLVTNFCDQFPTFAEYDATIRAKMNSQAK